MTATYTHGNSLIRKDGETPLFDGLGSERTVTNSSQSVTASLTLSAFGQSVASSGSSTSAYQFGATSGYRTEDDAGLTLVGCRFYDAQVGRFITRDTYLDQKPYAYCDGDPVNGVDPTGHNNWLGNTLQTIGGNMVVDSVGWVLDPVNWLPIGTGSGPITFPGLPPIIVTIQTGEPVPVGVIVGAGLYWDGKAAIEAGKVINLL